MPETLYLSVPKQYRLGMRKIYVKNIRQKLWRFYKRNAPKKDPIALFTNRYKSGEIHASVIDGAIDWYLSPLYHCEAEFSTISNTPQIHVLDLGCGPASVGHWLRQNDYQWCYTGVDIVPEAQHYFDSVPNSNLIEKDLNTLDKEDIKNPADIIFMINAFGYVDNQARLLRLIHEVSHDNTFFFIMDAYPASFWSNEYPTKRFKSNELTNILQQNGWKVERKFHLSVYTIFNKPFMNLSHAFLCSRILD